MKRPSWRTRSAAGSMAVAVLLAVGCRSVSALRQKCVAGETSACEAACTKGVAGEGGCFHAAEAHRQRAGLDFGSADYRLAIDLYRKACDGGYADGCLYAAEAIEAPYGQLDPPNDQVLPKMIGDREVLMREERLSRACSLGSIAGCKRLGDVLIGKHASEARAAYEKACRAGGDTEGCVTARAREVDIAEQLRVQCTHRGADACASLGALLISVDPPRARRLFASECELRGVAGVVGGLGAFVAAREREAQQGIPLPGAAAPHAAPPAGAPSVVARATKVDGQIALVEIDRTLAEHAGDLATCVAMLPPAPPLAVSARLIVDRTGDVFRATLSGAPLAAAVSACLTSALESLSFSEPGPTLATVEVILAVGHEAAPEPVRP